MKTIARAFLLLLAPLLLDACKTQGVKLADGTWVVNDYSFFHKADSEQNTTDVTTAKGDHIVMSHNATKPDGTEATKLWMYDMTKSLAKYTAHSTDIKTKGDTAVKLKGTKDPNIIPALSLIHI